MVIEAPVAPNMRNAISRVPGTASTRRRACFLRRY
jgi:hypothetical protein